MNIKEMFFLLLYGAGILAIVYLVLLFISFVAMIDGGGSGLILDSMKNPYVVILAVIFSLSLLLTEQKVKKIMTTER
jgi:fumarate reductase subunit C